MSCLNIQNCSYKVNSGEEITYSFNEADISGSGIKPGNLSGTSPETSDSRGEILEFGGKYE